MSDLDKLIEELRGDKIHFASAGKCQTAAADALVRLQQERDEALRQGHCEHCTSENGRLGRELAAAEARVAELEGALERIALGLTGRALDLRDEERKLVGKTWLQMTDWELARAELAGKDSR